MTRPFENAFPAMEAVKDVLFQAMLPQGALKAKGAPADGMAPTDVPGRGESAGTGSGGAGSVQWKRIGREVMSLHEAYTRGGKALRHDSNPIHGAMSGYQLYFLPRNLFRVHRVIQQLPWRSAAPLELLEPWLEWEGNRPVLRLLDLGCGSGAFGLAWLVWLAARFPHGRGAPEVHLTLVDQGRRLMALAQRNLSGFARRALPGMTLRMETHAGGVDRYLGGPPPERGFAVAGGAMMLAELNLLGPRRVAGRAEHFTEALRRRVREGGCIVLVEPGTRKGYMNLMAVRDRLAGLPVLYPCPHGEKCPFWHGRVTSWCHAAVRLPQPFFFDHQLKRAGGIHFEMREINLSALAVQVTASPGAGHPFLGRRGSRVVSAPLAPKTGKKGARDKSRNLEHGPKGKRGKKAAQTPPEQPLPEKNLVLVCEEDGRLHERPAGDLGRLDRGRWLEGGGGGP